MSTSTKHTMRTTYDNIPPIMKSAIEIYCNNHYNIGFNDASYSIKYAVLSYYEMKYGLIIDMPSDARKN